jgi:hypothetical protein
VIVPFLVIEIFSSLALPNSNAVYMPVEKMIK